MNKLTQFLLKTERDFTKENKKVKPIFRDVLNWAEKRGVVEEFLKLITLPGRSTASKTFVSVSDMHVGSAMALTLPEMYVGDNDYSITPNRIGKRLFEAWLWCIDNLSQKPHCLGVLGEPMDGANVKQTGQQSYTTNINDQIKWSAELLKMIKALNIVMIRGSGYHVHKDATNYEESVARLIGAQRYRAYSPDKASVNPDLVHGFESEELGAITDYFADIRINGKIFNLTHHIGYSKNEMYRTTGMAREMVTMKLSSDFYNKADIIARGHVHYFVEVGFTHTKGYTNPAWKLPDAHLLRGGQGGTKPDIGMVECIIESNERVQLRPLIVDTNLKPRIKDI